MAAEHIETILQMFERQEQLLSLQIKEEYVTHLQPNLFGEKRSIIQNLLGFSAAIKKIGGPML